MDKKEEERPQGSWASMALAAAAGVAAAWGISKMLSDSEEKEDAMKFRAGPSYLLSSSNSIRSAGRYKMNTDGTCRPHQGPVGYTGNTTSVMQGPSGYGGILRDGRGKWVRGFRGFIGVSDCLTAEFHGILKGLQLLDKLGFVDSDLESDCDQAVMWINEELSSHRSKVIEGCRGIINECKRLKNKNRITISACSRNNNKCADKLASMAIDKREPYVEIMSIPDEIKDIVYRESAML